MSKGAITARKIAIWRDEVNLSQKYCVCSRPRIGSTPTGSSTTAADSSDYTESSSPLLLSSPPSATQARHYDLWKDSSTESNPSSNPSDDSVKARSIVVSIHSKNEPFTCSTCGAPIDMNVAFAQLRDRGDEGFVRKWSSPRSDASLIHKESPPDLAIVEWYRNFKHRANKIEAVRNVGNKIAATLEDEKSTGKRILGRPLSKLFKGNKKKLSSLSEGDRKNRPRATEMYNVYHSESSSDLGSIGIQWSLSDGEYRRPRLAIDDAAARLRRAQRLLGKANKDNASSPSGRNSMPGVQL
ncbi:hypothetical protein F4818DRAFT_400964 [Hypoxylon cercidicola]|nr:hypothetical protein F4818DRAFT_400964 [Hypoxylon cercidicola]